MKFSLAYSLRADPYAEAGIRTSTKAAERAVVRYFSRLWRAPVPARASALPQGQQLNVELHSKHMPDFYNEAWSCVLTMGSTEGNLYSLRNARDYLKGKFLLPELYGHPGEIVGEDVPVSETGAAEQQERPALLPAPAHIENIPAEQAVPGTMHGGIEKHPQHAFSEPTLMHPCCPREPAKAGADEETAPPPLITSQQPPASIIHDNSSAQHLPPMRLVHAHRTPGARKANNTAAGAPDMPAPTAAPVVDSAQPAKPDNTEQDAEKPVERVVEAEVAEEAHSTAEASAQTMWDAEIAVQHPRIVHEPVLLYGSSAHYSIDKIRDLLEIHTPETLGNLYYPGQCPLTQHLSGHLRGAWPAKIPTHVDGRIQIEALVPIAEFFASRGHPLLLSLTYGTTFSGAYEDPGRVYRALKDGGCLHQDTYRYVVQRANTETGQVQCLRYVLQRRNYWLHVDSALGGWFGAYFNQEDEKRLAATAKLLDVPVETLPRLPAFDFAVGLGEQVDSESEPKGGAVMSIAMSGHKQGGAPWPTGLVMTLRRFMLDYKSVSYIAAGDTTLAGSRNAHSALFMWSYLARNTDVDHIKNYLRQAQLARNFAHTLATVLDCKVNEYGGLVFNAPHSLAVIFPRPTQETIDHFSLSCDVLRYPNPGEAFKGGQELSGCADKPCPPESATREGAGTVCCVGSGMWAEDLSCGHSFIMPHVTDELVCQLVRALSEDKLVLEAVQRYQQRVAKAGGALPPIYNDQAALMDVWGRVVEPAAGPLPAPVLLDLSMAGVPMEQQQQQQGEKHKGEKQQVASKVAPAVKDEEKQQVKNVKQ